MPSISSEQTARLGFQDALFQDGGLFARDARKTDSFDQYLKQAAEPGEETSPENLAPAPTPAPESPKPPTDTVPKPADARPKPAEAASDRRSDREASLEEIAGDRSGDSAENPNVATTTNKSSKESEDSRREESAEKPKADKPKKEESKAEPSAPLAQAQQVPLPAPVAKEAQAVAARQEPKITPPKAHASKAEHPATDATEPKPVDKTISGAVTALSTEAAVPTTTEKTAKEQTENLSLTEQNAAATPEPAKNGSPRRRNADNRRDSTDDAAHEGGKTEKVHAATQLDTPSQDPLPQNVAPTDDVPQPTTPATVSAAPLAIPTGENVTQSTTDLKPSTANTTQAMSAVDSRASSTQRTAVGQDLRSGSAAATANQGPDAGTVDRAKFAQRVAAAFRAACDPGGTVRLKLSPAELGSLRLEVSVRNGVMNAKIEAETEAARNLLLENLPLLRERLAAQDIKVQQFQIDLRDPGQGGQSGLPGQAGNSSSGDDPGRNAPQPRWNAATEDPRPTEPLAARTGVETGRLNVIV